MHCQRQSSIMASHDSHVYSFRLELQARKGVGSGQDLSDGHGSAASVASTVSRASPPGIGIRQVYQGGSKVLFKENPGTERCWKQSDVWKLILSRHRFQPDCDTSFDSLTPSSSTHVPFHGSYPWLYTKLSVEALPHPFWGRHSSTEFHTTRQSLKPKHRGLPEGRGDCCARAFRSLTVPPFGAQICVAQAAAMFQRWEVITLLDRDF